MGGVHEAVWYFEQVRPRLPGDEQAQLAAEEVLDHVGRLMGFETARLDDAAVSTWSSPSGLRMRVALVHTREAVVGLSRATRACDTLDHERARPGTPDGLLCVVCGDDSRDALEQALELRRMSRPVRLVGVNAVLALADSLEASALSHDLAAAALAPGASADGLISALIG